MEGNFKKQNKTKKLKAACDSKFSTNYVTLLSKHAVNY